MPEVAEDDPAGFTLAQASQFEELLHPQNFEACSLYGRMRTSLLALLGHERLAELDLAMNRLDFQAPS